MKQVFVLICVLCYPIVGDCEGYALLCKSSNISSINYGYPTEENTKGVIQKTFTDNENIKLFIINKTNILLKKVHCPEVEASVQLIQLDLTRKKGDMAYEAVYRVGGTIATYLIDFTHEKILFSEMTIDTITGTGAVLSGVFFCEKASDQVQLNNVCKSNYKDEMGSE